MPGVCCSTFEHYLLHDEGYQGRSLCETEPRGHDREDLALPEDMPNDDQ